MTTEQVKELAEALSILSAKSSVLKERNELRALMEENLSAEEVCATIESPGFVCTHSHAGPSIALRSSYEAYPYYVDED